MPALANIPLGFPKDGNWEKTNITSDEWVKDAINEVNCPVGTASVTAKFKNLPAGKYFVRFETATNVEMIVGGKSIPVGVDGTISASNSNSESFDFAGGDLELKISGKNKSVGFQFKIACIVLEVSQDIVNDVRNANSEVLQVYLDRVAADDDFEEAVELRAQRTDFINNSTKFNGISMSTVLKNLQTMANPNDNIVELENNYKKWIDLYKEYGLDQTPAGVLKAQTDWVAWGEEYNEKVAAENATWQRYLNNVTTRTNLLAEQTQLMTDAEQLKTQIKEFNVVDPELKKAYVEGIDAYITKLNGYKAEIEAAYADPAGPNRRDLREVISFESQKPVLGTEYNTLAENFNAFKTDYNAYYDINFIQLTNLKNAYDAYVAFLKGVQGIKGYENVYNDLVIGLGENVSFENPTADSKLGTANQTYDDTKNANQIKTVDGAAAEYQAKLAAITQVINDWKNLTDEFTQLVQTQNSNMTAAQTEVNNWNAKVAEYNKLTVPTHMQDQFDANLKAVTDAIAAFKEYIDTEYKAHTLNTTSLDYTAKVGAVNDAIDAMDNFVVPMKIINDLLTQLEKAKKAVSGLPGGGTVTGDDEGETTNVNIANRFNSTYEDLKVAILDLTLEEANNPLITGPISDQITKYQADAKTYSDYLKSAKNAISNFEKAYNVGNSSLVSFLNNKIFDNYRSDENTLLAEIKAKYTGDWETMFGTPIKSFRNDLYQAVILVNDQESFNALENLVNALNAAKSANGALSPDKFNAQKIQFAHDGTLDGNWQFGWNRLNNFKAALAAAVEKGVTNADKISTDAVENELNNIKQSDITDAQVARDIPGAYGKCDTKIKAALDKLQILIDRLADYEKTQANYDVLKAAWDALLPSLDGLINYNEISSLEPAKSFFANEKIGKNSEDSKEGTLGNRIFDLGNELENALENTKIVTDTQKKALQDKIDAINADITATRAAIELNNTKHNSQLNKEREERAHALDVISQIDNKGQQDGSADLDIMKQWKEELQSIIDNDIVNENVVVTNAYGIGESAAQDTEIMAAYKTIHEKIQSIEDQLNGDEYMNAVKDANTITTQSWDVSYYDKLMAEWRKAIQDFNYYYYDVDNQGWKNYIHEEIERHQEEFSSHADIDNLNAAVKAFIAEQNAKPHVITADEWKEWTDKADALSKVINDRVEALENEANTLATNYYTQQHGAAKNAVDDAQAALEAAGIDPVSYLAEANRYLSSAESMYAAATQDETTLRVDNLGRQMNAIANDLDKVVPAIDLQAACQDAWDDEYADALTQIANMRQQIEAADFCPDDVKAAYMQDFEEKAGIIGALNTEVKGVSEGLINSYKEYVESLKTLLEGMQDDADGITKASDLNKENKDIYDNFNTVWAPELDDQYEALIDFCNALGGSGDMQGTLDNIKGSIDALKEYVEAEKANLLDKNIKNQCDNIKDAIANAYKTAGEAEISWLRAMLKNTKIAFNDAMVKGTGTLDERLQALGSDKTQAGIEAEIHTISDAMDTFSFNPEDKEGFKTTAQGYENDLCGIYDLLQSTWNEQAPSVGIKAGLDGIYNEIDALITAGQAALEKCLESVQTDFAGQYEALKASLDAEQAAWNADGANVIAHEAAYKRNLNDIKQDVNDLTAKIADAQQAALDKAEKERVNNEKYTELKAQYDSLQNEFDAAKALVEGYENGIAEKFAAYAEMIQSMLDNSLAELNASNENVALTAESVLRNADIIASSINTYKTNATRQYAGIQFGSLGAKDDELSTLLTAHIVPAAFNEIKEALTPLRDNVSAIRGEYVTADFNRLNEIIAEAKGYLTAYDELIAKAKANTFIPGDVNLDGSVDVFDVQTLINMIGEGVTYEQLYAENPLEACAADVLDDDRINVADVTSIIYIIQGEDFNSNRVRAMKAAAQEVTANASLMLVSEENGVSRYALTLNNNIPFIAGQFEITVSGNSRVVGVSAAERASEHQVYMFETENGGARVVLANMENKEISGTDGAIVFIDVEGTNKVSTVDGQFADRSNRIHKIKDAHTSAVDNLIDNVKDGVEKIWDAAGRSFRNFQNGINIIRHKNGSVTKEIRK